MMTEAVKQLVTHDGYFHADEVLASVVLARLFPDAEKIRSRDPRIFSLGPGALYFDIGGEYDPARLRFDHHQKDAPRRADGTPYSSFGLIWMHFGRSFLISSGVDEAVVEAVHRRIDAQIVLPVDLYDNGCISPDSLGAFQGITLMQMIAGLNPTHEDRSARREHDCFLEAQDVALRLLDASVRQAEAECQAERIVRNIINRTEGPVMELPADIPFDIAIEQAGEAAAQIQFVIMPGGQEWRLVAVRVRPGSFEARKDLPAIWAGLSGEDLARETGVPDAVFCHRERFIAIAGSLEGIRQLAEAATAEPESALAEPAP